MNDSKAENKKTNSTTTDTPITGTITKAKKHKTIPDEIVQENAFSGSKLKEIIPLQKTIIEEITARNEPEEKSLAYLKNGFFYSRRFLNNEKYPRFFREQNTKDTKEELLLDINQLAADEEYFDFEGCEISPDNRLMAYAYDTEGEGNYTIAFMNLETRKLLPETLENCDGSMAWSSRSDYFFYIENAPTTLRPYRLMRHKIGEPETIAKCLFQELNEAFSLSISTSKTGRYLFLETEGNNSTETHILPADRPLGNFKCLAARKKNVEYYVEHSGKSFWVLTNENAKNFKLLQYPLNITSKKATVLIPEQNDVYIDDMEVFENFIVLKTRKNGLSGFSIYNVRTQKSHCIGFDEEVYECSISDNEVFESCIFRFEYSSFTTPDSIYDYDMRTGSKKLMHQMKVNTGFDGDNYIGKRLFAKSADGTSIPISLVHKKSLELNSNNPLIIYGYGAYGLNSEVGFSRALISLLDRGFVYATAHVRGGSELGRDWYEQGKMLNKKNSFLDYIACTEYLHKKKYSRPKLTFAHGESAGGLLVGAVANMRPELYRAIIAEMPFVDVVSTMCNKNLPLTAGEYEEWGNPAKSEEYNYILSYSPVDRVKQQAYPAMLIISAYNDSHVSYREALKWAKTIRNHHTGKEDILLIIDPDTGHFGASDRPGQISEIARLYAYMVHKSNTKPLL